MDRDDSGRWEYAVRRPTRDETKKEASSPESDLNELAADGWRFVETIEYTGGGTKYLVFERRVAADEEDGAATESRDDAGDPSP